MKKFGFLFMCVFLCLTSIGCSSKHMEIVAVPQQTIPEGKSTVTFYRYSSLGGAIQAPVAEVVNNDVDFVGILSVDTKIRQIVEPGEHTYVIGGESSSLLQAKLLANKHYFVRIEPRMGFWKARFAFVPISLTDALSEKVQKELNTCQYVTVNASGEQWFLENKESMKTKAQNAQQSALEKDIMDRAILPEAYGIDKAL